MIPQQTIQQVVASIDIVDIISSFVNLKRRGANYLGLCPFHDEKTPSFTVSPSKEIYKCFGCGKSGNTITFLMEHEKYSYVEAIRWLAEKYNIPIEESEASPEQKLQIQAAESLYAINNFAKTFFENSLFNTEEGRSIGLSYLKERGFRENTIKTFEIGYCPTGDEFVKTAIKNQYNEELLIKSGLVASRDGHLRDNYRQRIIFPVHNQSGKVIGFGARLIQKNDKAPKYINTPENEIYVKSRILYGLWQARQEIGKKNECLLVEGYTDVVSLHQAAITNVVASGGTSLTREQLRLIKKITNNLTIFYDGDDAGVAATLRGLDLALEEGLVVKIVTLPAPEDPDSYIKNYGAAALENYISENKKDFILFQLEWALNEAGTDSNKKAAVVKKIAGSISKLNKPDEFTLQQDYVKKVAARLQIEEAGLMNLVNSIIREEVKKQQQKIVSSRDRQNPETVASLTTEEEPETLNLLNREIFHERALVRCLLEYGLKPWEEGRTVADYFFEEADIEDFLTDEKLLKITQDYKVLFDNGAEPDAKNFLYSEDLSISNLVISLITFPYELSKNWKEKFDQQVMEKDEYYRSDINSVLRYIELKKIKKLIIENEAELQKEVSSQKLTVLIQTHTLLKNMELDLAKQVGMVIMR